MPSVLQLRRGTTSQNNAFTGAIGELSYDTSVDTLRVHDGSTAGGFALTTDAGTSTLTNKTLTSPIINTGTFGTSILPVSADGTTLGSATKEFSDLFLADGGTIQLGNDQDVTITHVADTGILLNGSSKIQFTDAAESIHSDGSKLILTSNSVAFSLPTSDGSAGQAMVTDASGNLSFAAAGATISADTSTNTDFLLYFAATTSGALTAVKQDSGLLYNPSSGTLTSAAFAGVASSAKYADLAEMYAADEAIEPGTVVMFGGEGKVAVCDTVNCRAVAGIVSTDPAYLMNSDQEGAALALAGRVPCKVTGPVAPGDMMVSAGNGMAMANNEAAMGTVIGKAIEANEGGEGVIEVLALMM